MTSSIWAADPVVSNISAVQRAGTKLLDFTFDVTATAFDLTQAK
jgi:hypothetical protein